MGVRDPRRDPEFLRGRKRLREISRIYVWVLKTQGDIPNFCMGVRDLGCMGVRDPGRDPEFLCGCKRPGERPQISVRV